MIIKKFVFNFSGWPLAIVVSSVVVIIVCCVIFLVTQCKKKRDSAQKSRNEIDMSFNFLNETNISVDDESPVNLQNLFCSTESVRDSRSSTPHAKDEQNMTNNFQYVEAEIHSTGNKTSTGILNENYQETHVRYLSPEGMKFMRTSTALQIRDDPVQFD